MNKTKKMLLKNSLATLLVSQLIFPTVTFAQNADEESVDQYDLGEVVVTANRIEQTSFNAHANISVVSREEIEKNHYKSVEDALKNVPGVDINSNNGSANYSTSININGTNMVLVLVDGQRVTFDGSAMTGFNPSRFVDMDNIERIEVLKGSASTLYGSDAAGGVINIITRKPDKDTVKTTVGVSFGNFNKRQESLFHQGMTQNGTYWSINYQKDDMGDLKDGHGRRVHHDIDSNTYSFKIGQKLDKGDISLNFRHYDLDYKRPDQGTNDLNPAIGVQKNNDITFAYDYNFNDEWKNSFNVIHSEGKNSEDSPAYGFRRYTEKIFGVNDQVTYQKGIHTAVAGIDFYRNEYEASDPMSSHLSTTAFFLQDTMQYKKLSFVPGVRFTHNSAYGTNTSFASTLGYDFTDNANVYVAYKEFFKAPTMAQLYGAWGANPNLDAIEGSTWELGTNVRLDKEGKTTLSGHIYKSKYDNGIIWDGAQYENTGAAKTYGWDLQAIQKLNDDMKLSVGYIHTHITATNGLNPNRDGIIPKGEWKIKLDYEKDKFSADVAVRGIINRMGAKFKMHTVPKSIYNTYWLMDIGVNYKPTDNLTLFAKLNNVFDRMYVDNVASMTNPDGQYFYAMPGRNFVVGASYTF